MNSKQSFLIIRFSSIGDILLATPLLRCLRNMYPEARIDFLVKKEFRQVLSGNPHINNLIVFDKHAKGEIKRIRKQVKQTSYTHIVDIQSNIRSLLISGFQKTIRRSFSKHVFARTLLIRFGVNIYRNPQPVFLRYFEAVKKAGVYYDGEGTEVFPTENDFSTVRELIKNAGTHQSQKFLIVAPGAQWENKRWPAEHFAAAADMFCADNKHVTILIGGPGDASISKKVELLMKTPCINLTAQTSLMGSAALLAMAELVFTNDTGMLHLSQAVKTPVVGVYGPTTRELGFYPLNDSGVAAEVDLSCRPCTQKGLHNCPKGHHNCMLHVLPETVAGLGRQILRS